MRTVDLFAGCGGFSLGFKQAGFDIVAAFDNWQPAIDIYRDNFTHPIFNQDLGDPEGYRSIADFAPELIICGPPCQDFSSAGKRNENLGRANLTRAFADIVCLVQPTWFVMENVSLITRSSILATVLEQFKNSGYGLTSTILNASYCGVPQSRKRYFLIGKLGGMNNNLDTILHQNQSDAKRAARRSHLAGMVANIFTSLALTGRSIHPYWYNGTTERTKQALDLI
jgi:DNA (cytosine-5)-methyltransferase 1